MTYKGEQMKLSEFKKRVIKIHGKEMWERIEDSDEYQIYTASERDQKRKVKENPYNVEYINNPSEEIKILAVKGKAGCITYINNPSEALQLQAVKKDGFAIQNIKNPSEKVQLEAVKKTDCVISFIKNPTDRVIREVINNFKYGENINFILRFIENDIDKKISLSELREMKLEEIKELIGKNKKEKILKSVINYIGKVQKVLKQKFLKKRK